MALSLFYSRDKWKRKMQQFRFWIMSFIGVLIGITPVSAMNVSLIRDVEPLFAVADQTEQQVSSDILVASYARPRMRSYSGHQVRVRKGLPSQRASLPRQSARLPKQRAGLSTEEARLPRQRASLPSQSARLPKQRASLPTQRHNLNTERARIPHFDSRLPRQRSTPRRYRGSLHISY